MINWHNCDNTLLYAISSLNLLWTSHLSIVVLDTYLEMYLLYQLFKNFEKIYFRNLINLEMISVVCVCVSKEFNYAFF